MKKPSEHNKSLHEKFEDFEFTPSDGGWDALQKKAENNSSSLQNAFAPFEFNPEKNVWNNLEKILQPQKKRKVVIWWSVAAGLVILISSTLFLSTSSLEKDFSSLSLRDSSSDNIEPVHDKNNKTNSTTELTTTSILTEKNTDTSSENASINNNQPIINSKKDSSTQNKLEINKNSNNTVDSTRHTTPPTFIKRDNLNRFKNRPPHLIATNIIIPPIQTITLPFSAIIPSDSIHKPSYKKRIGSDFSSLLASVSENTNSSESQSLMFSDAALATTESNLTNYADEKFSTPISIGLDFSIHLNKRIAIVSGINYTFLNSKAHYINLDWETKYAISRKYLGIPLSLKFEWIQKKKFIVYTKIGNQFDFGLKKKVRIKEIENGNEVNQSSISSKLGNQSKITSAIGTNYVLNPSFDLHFEGTFSYFYYQSHFNLWTERNFWPGLKIGITYKL